VVIGERRAAVAVGSDLVWGLSAGVCCIAMLGAGIAGGLALRRRRGTTTARAFAALMLTTSGWCLTDLLIALAGLGVLPAAVAPAALIGTVPLIAVFVATFWVLARSVADRDWRLRRRVLAALAAHPVLILLGVAVTPATGFLYTVEPLRHDQIWLAWSTTPVYEVASLYGYGLVAWTLAILIRAFRQGGPLQRRQTGRLLWCGLFPLPFNILITVTTPGMLPDLTAVGFAVTGVIATEALLRQGLTELVPVARSFVLERLRDAVLVLDGEGRLLDVNRAGVRLLRELAPDLSPDVVGARLSDLVPDGVVRSWLLSDGEHRLDLPDRSVVLDVRVEPLTGGHGRTVGTVSVIRDVTELIRLRDDLAEQALRDELTGLHNRRALMSALDDLVGVAVRTGRPLSLIMIDVDHFKSVNDEFGHAVGDALLAETARVLAGQVRSDDVLARFGGEEFVLLMPGSSLDQAQPRAEELRRRCAAATVTGPDGGAVRRTISLGVATLDALDGAGVTVGDSAGDSSGTTSAALLRAVDQALYRAKESGRDRVALAGSSANTAAHPCPGVR
jgi:diguanylate cyclase (GGDEF)-like protein